MRFKAWAGVVLSTVLLTGCATGRNYQADIDALNARIAALQGQLAGKDQQISTLQNQVNDERMAREALEGVNRSTAGAKRTVSDLK